MDWGKWIDGLVRDVGLAVIPVLTGALAELADGETAIWWAPALASAGLVGLRRLSNWLKHNRPPAQA